MPPKKKARLSSRAASTISKEAQNESIQLIESRPISGKTDGPSPELVLDAWTDEQETSLFKGMIRWKPVGMHKHFRMIALSQHLRNHGYNSSRDKHTGIPGIWQKLNSLYNLEALDEREDSFAETSSDSLSPSPSREPYAEFSLPKDFEDLMFAKRLAPTNSSSPFSVPADDTTGRRRPSTIEDSEEPRSSPASLRGTRSTRGTRGAKGTRKSGLQTQLTHGTSRASRASKASKISSEEDEDEDKEEEEEEEDEDEAETPASRKGASGGGSGRGRGQGGRWGKGSRGRGARRTGGRRR